MANDFDELWDRLVPESGQAQTVQGEVVRAVGRLAHDYFANGFANWDAGFERLASFAAYNLTDGTLGPQGTEGIRSDIEHVQRYGRGEDVAGYDMDAALERLQLAAVAWCQRHPNPIAHRPDPDLKR